jgi:branched-chain amino acid transport system permease protein
VKKAGKVHKPITTRKRLFLFVLFGWLLLILGDRVGDLELYQGSFVATYALGITSVILLTGYSGQLSLGQSALMAVGAYAGALSIFNAGWHPVIGLIMSALVAGVFGLVLGLVAARLSWSIFSWNYIGLSNFITNSCQSISNLGSGRGHCF